MEKMNRRAFVFGSAAMLAASNTRGSAAVRSPVKFRVGVTDWNLGQEGKVESIALARKLGFDGVQVSIGRGSPDRPLTTLPLSDPALQQSFLNTSKEVGLRVESLCLDALHRNFLKSDPVGQRWVAESIPIAAAMGVRVILLPFFAKGALTTQQEMDKVADLLKEVAPAAEKAGVILGLEDTVSARDNARMMDRTKSPAVKTYYDVGNSTNHGFDVVKEIRWLGPERICEVHLKDNPHYLGEGKIDFPAVIDALADIGFDQWSQLETDCPASIEADMRRNLGFIRHLISARNASV